MGEGPPVTPPLEVAPVAPPVQPVPPVAPTPPKPPQAPAQPPSPEAAAAASPAPAQPEQNLDSSKTSEEIRTEIHQAWGIAVDVIRDAYEIDPAKVAQQLKIQSADPANDPKIQAEIAERNKRLAANPQLKSALEMLRQADTTIEAAKQAVAKAQATGEAADKIEAEFYDGTRGIYHTVDADGKPTKKTVSLSHATKPVVEELGKIAEEKEATGPNQGQPTERAKKAKQLYDTLHSRVTPMPGDPDGHYLKIPEPPEPEAQTAKEAEEKLVTLGITELERRLREAGGEGEDRAFVIKDGVTKVDQGKLEKRLKELEADETTGHLALLLGTYYDEKTPPAARENLAALIYDELAHTSPDAVKALGEDTAKIFKGRLDELRADLVTNWLRPLGYNPTTIPDNILPGVLLAYQLESLSPEQIESAWAKLGLNPNEKKVAIALASSRDASNFLKTKLGINTETLGSDDADKICAEKAVAAIQRHDRVDPKNVPVEHWGKYDAYRRLIKENLSDDKLRKLLQKHGKLQVIGRALLETIFLKKNKLMTLSLLTLIIQLLQRTDAESIAGSTPQGGETG
jgi:hypothetical protein